MGSERDFGSLNFDDLKKTGKRRKKKSRVKPKSTLLFLPETEKTDH